MGALFIIYDFENCYACVCIDFFLLNKYKSVIKLILTLISDRTEESGTEILFIKSI